MSAEGGPGRPPAERRSAGLASGALRRYAVPAAAIALAILAIGAAYLISHTGATHSSGVAAQASASAPSYPTPPLAGALSPETGPDGMAWQWIGRAASIELAGAKRGWLAFRALSPRVPRTLSFSGPAGEHLDVSVQTAPDVYLVGPLSGGRILVQASPVAPARPGRPPSLAVFLSTLRAMPTALATVPGAGFWSTESSGGVIFNWMRGSATIDAYSPGTPSGRVWLTFFARSLGQQRTVLARSGATSDRVAVTTTAQSVKVGPFALVHGRARIVLRPSPGPEHYGIDPRALSIQVAELGGYTSSLEA